MKAAGRLRISGIWDGAVVAGLALVLSGAPTPDTSARSARPDAAWRPSLEAMESALGGGDVQGATAAWLRAHGEAQRARAWEGLVEVGQASLKVGANTNATARARRLFREALFRAREARSLDGVLAATHEFAKLGDRDVVAQGIRIGRQLAGENPTALERVRAFEETPTVAGLFTPRAS